MIENIYLRINPVTLRIEAYIEESGVFIKSVSFPVNQVVSLKDLLDKLGVS